MIKSNVKKRRSLDMSNYCKTVEYENTSRPTFVRPISVSHLGLFHVRTIVSSCSQCYFSRIASNCTCYSVLDFSVLAFSNPAHSYFNFPYLRFPSLRSRT